MFISSYLSSFFPLRWHTKSLRCFARPIYNLATHCLFLQLYLLLFLPWSFPLSTATHTHTHTHTHSCPGRPLHPHKHVPCPSWTIFRSSNRYPCFFLITKSLHTHLILLRTFSTSSQPLHLVEPSLIQHFRSHFISLNETDHFSIRKCILILIHATEF